MAEKTKDKAKEITGMAEVIWNSRLGELFYAECLELASKLYDAGCRIVLPEGTSPPLPYPKPTKTGEWRDE